MFWLFNHSWWGQTIFGVGVFIGLSILFRTLFLWRKNALYITDQRVVDIDQGGFFEKIVSDVPLDEIEDIFGKIKGIFGTIFRYGDLSIQTGKVNIIIEKIKYPVDAQQSILDLKKKYINKSRVQFADDSVSAIVNKINELNAEDLIKVHVAVKKRISWFTDR
jgi:hypothetical protein